jgi:hypothetical protein
MGYEDLCLFHCFEQPAGWHGICSVHSRDRFTRGNLLEVSTMNNRGIVTIAGTLLLSTFCLVTSPRAQDTNGTMTHDSNTMATDSRATDQMHNSMSDPAAVTGSATTKMKEAGKMHTDEDHMTNGQTSEGGHNGMMEGGSTGEMNH